MKYLIPIIVIILLIRFFLKKKKSDAMRTARKGEPELLKQDPVCGAYVTQKQELSLHTAEGTNYFCSRSCMERFKELKH